MISKLINYLTNMNNFEFVSLKCLEILIQIREDEDEEDIIDELNNLENYIQIINTTEFEDSNKLIRYINGIAL